MQTATPIGRGDLENFVVKGSTEWQERRKALGFGDVRIVDPESTSFAMNYVRERNFVHMECCTPGASETTAGEYGEWTYESLLGGEAKPVADEGEVAQGGLQRKSESYIVRPMGYMEPIGDQLRAEASPVAQLDMTVAAHVSWVCAKTREKEFANVITTAGNWGGQVTGGTQATATTFDPYDSRYRAMRNWSDAAQATPLRDIDIMATKMMSRTGYYPNTLILGAEVPIYLRNCDDFIDRVNRGQTPGEQAKGALRQLSDYMMDAHGIPSFQTRVMTEVDAVGNFINRSGAWLGYVEPMASTTMPTAIVNFYWTRWGGADTTIDSFYDQKSMKTYIRGVYANTFKVAAKDCGIAIASVI